MTYLRPRNEANLTASEKRDLIEDYLGLCRAIAINDRRRGELNVKLPRAVFDEITDEIGALLLERSAKLASEAGPVRDFLERHVSPGALARLLPDDYRVFCLALNAIKQWVSAEQAATDRYLLGGSVKRALRGAADACTITGDPVGRTDIELHHIVRDGRPPIPVSKAAHAMLERQTAITARPGCEGPDPATGSVLDGVAEMWLLSLKREANRSWIMLRRGCLDLLDRPVEHSTPAVRATSRSFANKAAATTGRDYGWILSFLDRRGLGS